jgi:DNA topoisomerase-6 subunit A
MSISRESVLDEVIQALHGVASEMHDKMVRGKPPTMTLPVRSKSNNGIDQKLGVYKYGKKRTIRDATNLGSAKQLLRSLHVTELVASRIVLFLPYL